MSTTKVTITANLKDHLTPAVLDKNIVDLAFWAAVNAQDGKISRDEYEYLAGIVARLIAEEDAK